MAYFESLVDDNSIDFVKERSIFQFTNFNTTISSGVGIFLLPPLVLYVDASRNNTLIFVEYWKTAVRSTISNSTLDDKSSDSIIEKSIPRKR